MAVQIDCEELTGCATYLQWICEKIACQNSPMRADVGERLDKNVKMRSEIGSQGEILGRKTGENKEIVGFGKKLALENDAFTKEKQSQLALEAPLVIIVKEMLDTDFICYCSLGSTNTSTAEKTMKDDGIRVTDAMELRRRYAEEVGEKAGKSERDIDRIWKSIHGKCSVLELIMSLCFRLDEMLNEEEPGQMIGMFFRIFIRNLGFSIHDGYDSEEEKDDRKAIIERFMKREYQPDGSGGGLFPIQKWNAEMGSKDQREVSIWYQMGTWLNEHLDEDKCFVMEHF